MFEISFVKTMEKKGWAGWFKMFEGILRTDVVIFRFTSFFFSRGHMNSFTVFAINGITNYLYL